MEILIQLLKDLFLFIFFLLLISPVLIPLSKVYVLWIDKKQAEIDEKITATEERRKKEEEKNKKEE